MHKDLYNQLELWKKCISSWNLYHWKRFLNKKDVKSFFHINFIQRIYFFYSFHSGLETIQIRAFLDFFVPCIIIVVKAYAIRKQESFLKKDFTLFYSARIHIWRMRNMLCGWVGLTLALFICFFDQNWIYSIHFQTVEMSRWTLHTK